MFKTNTFQKINRLKKKKANNNKNNNNNSNKKKNNIPQKNISLNSELTKLLPKLNKLKETK